MSPPQRWIMRCAGCRDRITITQADQGNALTAMDDYWHSWCCVCLHCEKPLGNQLYRTSKHKPNRMCCLECSLAEVAVNCSKCGKGLFETHVQGPSGPVHKECLRCEMCKDICKDGIYNEKEGKLLDEKCSVQSEFKLQQSSDEE